jgi:GNAT superfamily N-acetyltransferase
MGFGSVDIGNLMKPSYRKAAPEDSGAIREMFYHALFVPDGQPRPSKQLIESVELGKYYDEWGKPGDSGWLALSKGGTVGAAWLRLFSGGEKGYGYVDDGTPELSIAVLPEFRNRGIGSVLLDLVMKYAAGRFDKISLSVTKENPARRLYKRFGFQEIAAHENDVIMLRIMTPGAQHELTGPH